MTGCCQRLYPPHLQSHGKVPWRQGCCIIPLYVRSPCLPSCSAYDLCFIRFTSTRSRLYLSSSCATPLSSLSPYMYFLSFITSINIATLPPVSALPLCHCLPCPLFCVFYFNYSNHILHSLCFPFTLCPSLQAFSPFFPLFPSRPSFAMFFLLFKTPGPSCSKQG